MPPPRSQNGRVRREGAAAQFLRPPGLEEATSSAADARAAKPRGETKGNGRGSFPLSSPEQEIRAGHPGHGSFEFLPTEERKLPCAEELWHGN